MRKILIVCGVVVAAGVVAAVAKMWTYILAFLVMLAPWPEVRLPPRPPFPPQTREDLQEFVEHFAPLEIITAAPEFFAAAIPRPSAGYTNLQTYFFAYPCTPYGAHRLIRSDSQLDNSIQIRVPPMVVQRDPNPSRPLNYRMTDLSNTNVFPDLFSENWDMSSCNTLLIRMANAPDWYRPDQITNGLADRCWWGRGRVVVEMYFDSNKQTAYLRLDELRPY